jgi:CBS domain-containing protein
MAKIEKHFTRDPIGLEATAHASDAARLMMEHKIGAVLVRDRGHTVGLVTERDLVYRVLAGAAGGDPPLGELVRRDLPSVSPEATEIECAHLMRAQFTRHLLVKENAEVAGIISMRDVIQLLLDEKQYLIDQLQSYIYRG